MMRRPGRRNTGLDESRMDEESAEADIPFLSRIDGADPADVLRRQEIAGRLERALEDLPHYHRAVIVMREVDGLSYDEMAIALGVSKGTIMSRLFHARQKLQKALADCYEEHVGGGRASTSIKGSADTSAAGDVGVESVEAGSEKGSGGGGQ